MHTKLSFYLQKRFLMNYFLRGKKQQTIKKYK